jgi:hypothetical protein
LLIDHFVPLLLAYRHTRLVEYESLEWYPQGSLVVLDCIAIVVSSRLPPSMAVTWTPIGAMYVLWHIWDLQRTIRLLEEYSIQ